MFKYLSVLLLAVFVGYFYSDKTHNIVPYIKNLFIQDGNTKTEVILSPTELELYNGKDKPQLYLAILGNVFDVTKGEQHYGPGQSYNAFVGRDASRSFITGKFEKTDITDDVIGLSHQELRSLNNWLQFYKKDYVYIGKVVGRYYNTEGKLTPYGKQIKKLVKEAEQAKEDEEKLKVKYPPCNVEWEQQKGTKVWCSDRSGGIARDWVGVPRQLYEAGSQNFRCACFELDGELINAGNVKEYPGCDSKSEECFVKA